MTTNNAKTTVIELATQVSQTLEAAGIIVALSGGGAVGVYSDMNINH